MTKKDIFRLFLAPSLMFVSIAAIALVAAYISKRDTNVNDTWQRLNAFTDGVRSGKLHVSTEQLLQDIRNQHQIAENWRHTCFLGGILMAYFGFASLCGLALQVFAILRVTRRIGKP